MSSAQPTQSKDAKKTATTTITATEHIHLTHVSVCVSLRSRWPSYSDQQSKHTRKKHHRADCTKKDDRKHEIRMICMNKMDLIIQFASLILNCKFVRGKQRKNNSQRLSFGWHRFTQLFFVFECTKMEWFPMCDFSFKSHCCCRWVFSIQLYFIKTPQAKRKLSKKKHDFNKLNEKKDAKTECEKHILMHLEWLNNWCCWIAPDSFIVAHGLHTTWQNSTCFCFVCYCFTCTCSFIIVDTFFRHACVRFFLVLFCFCFFFLFLKW